MCSLFPDNAARAASVDTAVVERKTVEVKTEGRILVHMCCGPCSIYPIKAMLPRMAVWGYFHNPNIHPYAEFRKRVEAAKTLAGYLSIDIICDEEYRPLPFIRALKSSIPPDASGTRPRHPPKDARCAFCYRTRLEETARAAKEMGFDCFSTSMLYSRYQYHKMIKEIGVDLAERYGILFYYEDFRDGWQEGIDRSKEMGLYRQRYCGCIYSRIERYSGKKPNKGNSLQKKAD
ncbi:MAG: epoxyqueuosine reductase QueH [Deltaproteobacteria bacterium]|nr:epoxyqueuosine reductase QueH [Deltaproteobacteria bacterium]